jgi:hypothetical protein
MNGKDIVSARIGRAPVWLIALLLASGVVLASGVILSNTLRFQGDLAETALTVATSEALSGRNIVSGVNETYAFNVTNNDDVQLGYRLNFTFAPSMAVASVNGSLNGAELAFVNASGTWYAESQLFGIFAGVTDSYTLDMKVVFSGTGTYTLDIEAHS